MSDACLANTWLSTQVKGSSVYRLTSACAELFDCAAGSYCPAGSFTGTEDDAAAYFAEAWWPGDGFGGVSCAVSAGRDETVWAYACACGNGFWCDANTAMPKFCPQGYYCETPAKIKKCPEGSYCKEGSVEPRACKAAQVCPRGSAVPEQSASGLVWFVLISLVAYVVFKLRTRYQEDAMRREVQELEDYHDVVEAAERKREAKQTAAVSFEEARASSPKDNGETYKIEFEDIRLFFRRGGRGFSLDRSR